MKSMKISTSVKVRVAVKANERVQYQQAKVKVDQQLLEVNMDKSCVAIIAAQLHT